MGAIKVGTDIVSVSRIEKLLKKEPKFLTRYFTKLEREHIGALKSTKAYERVAGKFACKEAVSKALGTGLSSQHVRLNEIEVLPDTCGAPVVTLKGKTKNYYSALGYTQLEASISHSSEMAIAVCIIN
ncbi:MAG: holo-ACP synthase [Firmicutes bacterium]|nr:holo-ACP synthase [Bacillota bacterium]